MINLGIQSINRIADSIWLMQVDGKEYVINLVGDIYRFGSVINERPRQ